MSQLIAIDPNALESLTREVERLHQRLDAVQMQPQPEWLTVKEYADYVGRHPRTITRRIEAGELEACEMAGARMVRVNQASGRG